MSTATIAFVRGVIAASTAARVEVQRARVDVREDGRRALVDEAVRVEAANEYGDVITSSPGPMPAAMQQQVQARPCRTRRPPRTARRPRSASSSSKRSIVGPSESRPERSTSSTSSSSRSSRHGAESGIRVVPAAHASPARRGGVLEPLRPALAAAAHRVEVRLLDLQRDRARAPISLVVDRAERRHLGGRAGHEHLVGEVEVGADQRLLDARGSRGPARSGSPCRA